MGKKGVSSHTHTSQQLNHHANQLNPNSSAYKASSDNRSNQMNPNNSSHQSKK